MRPRGDVPAGPHGWTHSDFQYRNLLCAGGELTAILDWDRLGVRPYAEEVVRTAQVQFGVEGIRPGSGVGVRGWLSIGGPVGVGRVARCHPTAVLEADDGLLAARVPLPLAGPLLRPPGAGPRRLRLRCRGLHVRTSTTRLGWSPS
ncbi:phosphotransferase [Streptomyces sp. NPDC058548]|uniref:phosphotransferase n=1 Tax=unclassified Streptomyces TaxID=2593676 RepID=UPI0036508FAB